jgi:hypothetical protein
MDKSISAASVFGAGSIALTNISRSTLIVMRSRETEGLRLLFHAKGSFVPDEDRRVLGFRLRSDPNNPRSRAKVEWEKDYVNEPLRTITKKEQALDFLYEQLKGGAKLVGNWKPRRPNAG